MSLTLVLASASSARLATLRSAGVFPRVQVSGVDEAAVLVDAESRYGALEPADAALVLARAKAESVAAAVRRADPHLAEADLVLGCDSVLEIDGFAYGKPGSANEARRRWALMSGRSGVLHTGHWLVDVRHFERAADTAETADADNAAGAALGATGSTLVQFARLWPAEIDAYVATGEPLGVAGAFTVDGLGGPYVERIEGDYHNVVGVSLPLIRGLLGELGIPWHALTAQPPPTSG